jgi:alkylation response protein AidB-like acyl-CoA dehydrogenase
LNVAFAAEQIALRDSVRELLTAHASPAVLRNLWATDTGRSPVLWDLLTDVGVPAILVPEEFGGAGGDELDLALVLEEVGYAALPDAILESCLLAPYLIATSASKDLRDRWLPLMATGSARVTAALSGSDVVPDLHVSDGVLLHRDGEVLLLATADIAAEPLSSMDPSRRLFRARPLPGAGEPLAAPDLDGAVARSRAGSAAILNGVAGRLVALAVEYAKARTQFGRPIGSFQAIKHQLAQAASMNALARHATTTAMYKIARHSADHADAAALAHLCAVEAEAESNRVALQVHGGVGFTWEHDLQTWLKYGKTLELAYGSRRVIAAISGAGAFEPHDLRSI